ncbi:hypothetical protein [Nannocystis pusilla]
MLEHVGHGDEVEAAEAQVGDLDVEGVDLVAGSLGLRAGGERSMPSVR